MKRRRYTDDFRASTVLMLEAAGYPDTKGALQQVADNVGVAAMTISRWFHASNNPPPNELVTIKREDILNLIKKQLHRALTEMDKTADDADYRSLATAAGILTDKMELLEGRATERVERYEYTDSERANEVEKLLDSARARAAGLPAISSEDTIH